MKRIIITSIVALAIPVATVLGFSSCAKPVKKSVKLHTEDMPTLSKQSKDVIQIQFVDSVEGRPTYNVLFSDSTGLDSMYPEEIAHGLATGSWTYDEMLTITSSK